MPLTNSACLVGERVAASSCVGQVSAYAVSSAYAYMISPVSAYSLALTRRMRALYCDVCSASSILRLSLLSSVICRCFISSLIDGRFLQNESRAFGFVMIGELSQLCHSIPSSLFCISHNLRSPALDSLVKSSTESPLTPLVVQIAGNALALDVAVPVRWVVPTGGHIPPRRKMSCLEIPNMVTLATGVTLCFTKLVCCSVSDVFAEPLIDLLLKLSVCQWFLGPWFLAQLLAGLAVRLRAPLWHGPIIRRESLPPMPRALPCLSCTRDSSAP